MKILHVTSDNKPGGIQKAFEAYLSALTPISQFENFCFAPQSLVINKHQNNPVFIKMSWLQKTLIRRGVSLPVQRFQNGSFNISFEV